VIGPSISTEGMIVAEVLMSSSDQSSCPIISTTSQAVKVVGGGFLDSCGVTGWVSYTIQKEGFQNNFKLLQLKGYDIILGCDWIKRHSSIGLDLRDCLRQLIIQKDWIKPVTFHDFTNFPTQPVINATILEKLCRT
jgi:hypothetical protein